MTVSNQTNKISYIGNGVTKEFAIPFCFLEKEHITVYQMKGDIESTAVADVDYSVSGIGEVDGGTLIFLDAPATGTQIVIVRNVPMTQEVDYRENEIFPAKTHERALDKLTMAVQQLSEKMERAVTVDIFSEEDPNNFMVEMRSLVSSAAAHADIAESAAGTASTKANVASAKAEEAVEAVEDVLDGFAGKANVNLSNVTKMASISSCGLTHWANGASLTAETRPAVIIAVYSNGSSWFRKWSDGWIEQGGVTPALQNSASGRGVSFNTAFVSPNYSIMLTGAGPMATVGESELTVTLRATTYFCVASGNALNNREYFWIASGY